MRKRYIQRRREDGTFYYEEVGENYRPAPNGHLDMLVTEKHYEGLKATDGTPIDSRAKHRRYMKEKGLAPADDFSPQWYENRRKEIAREQAKERFELIKENVAQHER